MSNQHVERLLLTYGNGSDGASPTRAQWFHVLERVTERSLTLVNFFKLRGQANYSEGAPGSGGPVSGQEAFDRYAAVSMPALDRVGGKFLLVAPFESMFIGRNEDWDLIAIGSYPNTKALLALFDDEDYRASFEHRTAACERQKVYLCPSS